MFTFDKGLKKQKKTPYIKFEGCKKQNHFKFSLVLNRNVIFLPQKFKTPAFPPFPARLVAISAMSTTKKDNSNLKSCPFTVTVRRNPPRRARATPSHGITPFPNEEILSEQVSHIPSATSEDEILKNPSSSENENPINPTASENENLINPTTSEENENLKVFLRIRPSQPPNQAQRVRAKTAWPKKQTKNVTNNLKKKSSSSCISINDSQSVTLLVPSDLQDAKRVKSETYGGFSHVFPSDSSQVVITFLYRLLRHSRFFHFQFQLTM